MGGTRYRNDIHPCNAARRDTVVVTSDDLGRERELEILRAAVADARAGRGGVVLVAGAPGIGKTRTVTEALRDLPPDRVLGGVATKGRGCSTVPAH